MIEDFSLYLTGRVVKDSKGNVPYSILPGGRKSYIININRGNKNGEWVRYADEQYYLDISVTPLITKK